MARYQPCNNNDNNNNNNNITRGHAFKLRKLQCNVDSAKHYFTNRVVNLWNNLPENVVAATTVSIF